MGAIVTPYIAPPQPLAIGDSRVRVRYGWSGDERLVLLIGNQYGVQHNSVYCLTGTGLQHPKSIEDRGNFIVIDII